MPESVPPCAEKRHTMYFQKTFIGNPAHLWVIKKPLHMEQAINTTAGTFELIALNICTQLLAFQESITKRESGTQFPTMQETGLLVKLINCLDKLSKLAAPFKAANTFNNFFKFLAADDKELAARVKAKYKVFMEQSTTTGEVSVSENIVESQTPSPTPPATNSPVSATLPPRKYTNRVFNDKTIMRRNAPSQPVYSLDPPFSSGNLETHRSLLFNADVGYNQTTRIDGRARNTSWVQYNLFQFLLAPADRRFYHDESNYNSIFNHYLVANAITLYCSSCGIKPM